MSHKKGEETIENNRPMAELSPESLLASINALTAKLSDQQEQLSSLSSNFTELEASAENSVAELNTFYLMWAGTPLS